MDITMPDDDDVPEVGDNILHEYEYSRLSLPSIPILTSVIATLP
jgi:hypothetical protein